MKLFLLKSISDGFRKFIGDTDIASLNFNLQRSKMTFK